MCPAPTLSIPQPCAERWAAMTPTAAGRHCAACHKTVVDFTLKTDAEILDHLRQAAGGTCGRFHASQLQRPLQPLPVRAPSRWRAWLAAAVTLWGARETVGAKAGAQTPTHQQAPGALTTSKVLLGAPVSRASATPPPQQQLVRGVVNDSTLGTGLPGVTVLLAGTTIGTSTDVDGHFSLEIPDSLRHDGRQQLTFSFIGYSMRNVPLAACTAPIALALQGQTMGEVVLTRGAYGRPWPWHPRRFFSWCSYWFARPFRRG